MRRAGRLLVIFDLATDARGGTTTFHLTVDGAIGSVTTVRLAPGARRLAPDARELREQGAAIDTQFTAWGLGVSADPQVTRGAG